MEKANDVLSRAQEKVYKILPKFSLNIQIEESPEHTIPELGISGEFVKAENAIHIWIDSAHPNMQSHMEEEITRSFAHEYMHAYREQKIPWVDGTLLECLVSEGISQNFELEVWEGGKPASYASALSDEEIERAWKEAQPLLHEHEYDYYAWFFGSEEKNLKRWTGYSLGYWLVKRYMEKTGKKASELAQEKSEYFLE